MIKRLFQLGFAVSKEPVLEFCSLVCSVGRGFTGATVCFGNDSNCSNLYSNTLIFLLSLFFSLNATYNANNEINIGNQIGLDAGFPAFELLPRELKGIKEVLNK